MAKFGGKEDSGYDPFNQISSSLSALKETPAINQPTPDPDPEPENEVPPPAASSRERPVERVQEPKPSPVSRPQIGSSGGGVRGRVQQPQPSVSPEIALGAVKRFKTTHEEGLRINQAALKLAAHLGTSVDMSKITRALWDVYLRHEDEILRSIDPGQPTRRPANNDAVGLAELDEYLADLISEGLMMASMRQRRG